MFNAIATKLIQNKNLFLEDLKLHTPYNQT
jgi:hypothetical protein